MAISIDSSAPVDTGAATAAAALSSATAALPSDVSEIDAALGSIGLGSIISASA